MEKQKSSLGMIMSLSVPFFLKGSQPIVKKVSMNSVM